MTARSCEVFLFFDIFPDRDLKTYIYVDFGPVRYELVCFGPCILDRSYHQFLVIMSVNNIENFSKFRRFFEIVEIHVLRRLTTFNG